MPRTCSSRPGRDTRPLEGPMHPKRTMGPCAQCSTPFLRRTRRGKPKRFCSAACLNASCTPEGRFWSKVDKDGPVPDACPDLGACWLWMSSTFTDSGYGQFWLNGTNRRAHIVSYEWAKGETGGAQVQHLCNIVICVRPTHLALGTPAENTAYAVAHGRMAHGERHGMTALTDEDVRMIRRLAREGTQQIILARRFGLGKSAMSSLIRGLTWKSVT
jgi:hypothetical protein